MSTHQVPTCVLLVAPSAAVPPFPPLGTTWVEAAEGAANPTLAVAGGVNVGSIREQKVRLLRRPSGTRPVANSVSGIGNGTVIKIDIPTTDKSQW